MPGLDYLVMAGKLREGNSLVAIEPMEDRLLVAIDEALETKTESGLLVVDLQQRGPQEGSVVGVGPGRMDHGQRVPMDVEVGDRVLFSRYGATEVEDGSQKYLLIEQRDVLAIRR